MRKIIPLVLFFISVQLFAQEDAWVFFKDKPNSATFLSSPLTMLSQRALDRRTRQNITPDIKDVPIEASYYSQIKNVTGITVLAKSKWLNAIHVQGTQTAINNLKTTFSFIESVEFADRSLNSKSRVVSVASASSKHNKFQETTTNYNYGATSDQVQMLKADFLHQQGFTGSGMIIAVIDAGFPLVNTLNAFQRIRNNNQILGGYDYVKRSDNFYVVEYASDNTTIVNKHGTNVLSTIAGYLENQFVGTAPDASFYLFRTEDPVNEVPLEESLWVEAAEKADSLGVDVINTSLGYSSFFDETRYNYTYADMNGETAFISRGAAIGVTRGMILVNSAGNEGNDSWKYMNAPADVPTVFTVGAVNSSRQIASFSSFGPNSVGVIKPDVSAQGWGSSVINVYNDLPTTSNGTSFSSPIMAGAVACFWQAFPNLTYLQIMQRIRESADRYNNPHEQYGYGIPDLENAYNTTLSVQNQYFIDKTSVYPNPVYNFLTIKSSVTDLANFEVTIYNVLGKKVINKKGLQSTSIDVSNLKSGIYILQIRNKAQQKTIKLIKK